MSSFDATFWDYLSPYQRDLIREGSYLYQEVFENNKYNFKDYAFLVFPFAKAYEGFMKQFLLDDGLISESQYHSDHIRIGLLLCPDIPDYDQRSIYARIAGKNGSELAESMWTTWKYCRNQVFHYYPHNSKAIDLIGAKERIEMILMTINSCYKALTRNKASKLSQEDHYRAANHNSSQIAQ